jgi:hypothetical protein
MFGRFRWKGARYGTWRTGLAGLLVLAGCQLAPDDNLVDGTESTSPRTEVPSGPVILSFEADDTTLEKGESTTLSWEVNDPQATLKIAPLAEVVEGSSKTVTPAVTTTYTLTAVNFMGTVTATVTVSVSSKTPDRTTGSDPYADAEWVEATGNLAGLPSECGNVSFVASRRSTDTVLAGIALQGLWASESDTDSWVALGQGPESATISNRTTSILEDPDDPDAFWQSGMYGGGGAYYTANNGVSFEQLGDVTHIDFISVDFTDPERRTLLSGAHEARNVFRSTDGGMTWVDVSGGLPRNTGYSTAGLVLDAETFLLGTVNSTGSGVFRTTDAGTTWEQVVTVGVQGAPLVSAVDGTIYWLLETSQGMIKSTDDGVTWEKAGSGPYSTDSGSIQEMEDGRLVTVGGDYLVVSSDQGDTWQRFGPLLPYSPRGIAYSPFRQALYIWRWDCSFVDDNSVPSDAIMRLDLVDEASEVEDSVEDSVDDE